MTEVDTARLASSGRAPSHAQMAARSRRFGVWFYAETTLRGMRAFALPILVYAVAQPLLYMVALGVGLGALVDRGTGPVDGVDYLTFVAPALLISTVVMSVTAEMTYPVMSGFKWNRLYYGPVASPLQPAQIDALINRWIDARRRHGVGYTNQAVELKTHGEAPERLMIDARNQQAVEIARHAGIPASAIDASVPGTSLTYANLVDRVTDLVNFGLTPYATAITDRLSLNDCLPVGIVALHDYTSLYPAESPHPERKPE